MIPTSETSWSDQVGEVYDEMAELVEIMGGNIHVGYWESDDDPAPGRGQAVERPWRLPDSAARSRVARSSRARATRERMVPTGHRHTCAASP